MSFKYRVNPGNAVAAVFGVAAVAAVGSLVWYLNQPAPAEPTAPALREWLAQKQDGTEYTLAGPGQVVALQGPLTHTFNFDTGHVYVTGGEINHAYTLRTFENDTMVAAVKNTGCTIAANTTGQIAAYKASPSYGAEYGAYLDEYATMAAAYSKNHCPR